MRIKAVLSATFAAVMLCAAGYAVSAEESEYEYIRIEAESGRYSDNFTEEKAADASGGKYLADNSSATLSSFSRGKNEFELECPFTTEKTDVYFIWARVMNGNVSGTVTKTGFYGVDDSYIKKVTYEDAEGFQWICVKWGVLEQGDHTLYMAHSGRNTAVDSFVITNDPYRKPDGTEVFPTVTSVPKNGETAKNPFSLPAYTPPPEHPRIDFTAADLPRIRENLNHPQNKTAYEALMTLADTDIGEAKSGYQPYTISSNFNDKWGAVIEANAFLYQINGDTERGKNAIRWARNYVSTTGINQVTSDENSRNGSYTSYIAAKVYDWCYDLLTEEDKKYLQTFMLLRQEQTETGWPAVKYMYHINGHALEVQMLRDALACGIALYDERTDVYNLVAGRILERVVPAHKVTDHSIFTSEGASYGPFRFLFQLECAALFKGMGYENVFNSLDQQFALYGMFYMYRPDGTLFNIGDNYGEGSWGFKAEAGYVSACFMAANLYRDPYLKAQYHRLVENGTATVSSTGFSLITPTKFLIYNDVNTGVSSMRDLPLSVFSNYPQGYMAARTSWDEGAESDTVAALMNIQQCYLHGHQHKDSGSFDIYYKGMLSGDSGVYQGTGTAYGKPHHVNYARQAIAHNTMLIIDPKEPKSNAGITEIDGGQRGEISVAAAAELEDISTDKVQMGSVLSYGWGPDYYKPAYTYMKGDMTKAYTSKVENFQRTFMFLNLFDEKYPAALIVFDDLTSSNASFQKKWLLHSQEEPEIDKDTNTVTLRRTEFQYDGRLINQSLLPEKVKYNVVGGEGHEFEINGVNFAAGLKSVTQDAGKWRTEISPQNAEKQDYFLNVIQVGENDESVKPLKAEIAENNDVYIGVSVKDRVVYLKKNGKQKCYGMKIVNEESDEQCMYIVTGLAGGKWTIIDKNGKSVDTKTVTNSDDSLCFAAKRGNYTLKYEYEKVAERDLTLPANLGFAPKTDIDVMVDTFYETLSEPMREVNGVLYAPVKAALDKLEAEYTEQNGVFAIGDSEKFSAQSDGAAVMDGILYIEAEKLLESVGASVRYDSVGKVARITYGRRRIDNITIHKWNEPGVLDVKRVTASAATENAATLALDGNTSTYWFADGLGEWIMAELEQPAKINKLQLYWNSGHLRLETFDVELSSDGKTWEKGFSGQSLTRTEQGWDDVPVSVSGEYKYIRLTCYGNTINTKNSLKEMKIFGTAD